MFFRHKSFSLLLKALDNFRCGQNRLICQTHDLLFILAAFVINKILFGYGKWNLSKYCQPYKREKAQQWAAGNRHNV